MPTITREVRTRGFLGRLCLLAFLFWNGFMIYVTGSGMMNVAAQYQSYTDPAKKSGASAGMAAGFAFLLFVWFLGSIIIGLFVLMTRGEKHIITTETL